MRTLSALVVTVLISGALFCNGYPTTKSEDGNSGNYSTSSNTMLSSGNGYQVVISQNEVNGNCVSKLTISGHGIHKEAEYSCQTEPWGVINMNNSLVVGKVYFTDTPSVLVHLNKDTCLREDFQEDGGKFTSTVTPMEEHDCDTVREKIKMLEELQKKWDEWYTQQQQSIQQQLQQTQQQLQNFQQQVFGGGLFGGWPFGKKDIL